MILKGVYKDKTVIWRIMSDGDYECHWGCFPKSHISKIIGRLIRLSDIIFTINNMPKKDWEWKKFVMSYLLSDSDYDLTDDNLTHQSPETINFLHKILVGEKE